MSDNAAGTVLYTPDRSVVDWNKRSIVPSFHRSIVPSFHTALHIRRDFRKNSVLEASSPLAFVSAVPAYNDSKTVYAGAAFFCALSAYHGYHRSDLLRLPDALFEKAREPKRGRNPYGLQRERWPERERRF
jgi:hypothetical protein